MTAAQKRKRNSFFMASSPQQMIINRCDTDSHTVSIGYSSIEIVQSQPFATLSHQQHPLFRLPGAPGKRIALR
jgi:hypothetical protein